MNIELVTTAFPGRDLDLAPVSLRGYALQHMDLADNIEIGISQGELDEESAKGDPTKKANEITAAILKKYEGSDLNLVGFTTRVWNANTLLHVAKNIKTARPKTKILFGGPQVGSMASRVLNRDTFVDYIIEREGEIAFSELLISSVYNTDINDVSNLYHRTSNGIVRNTRDTMLNSKQKEGELSDLVMPWKDPLYRDFLDTHENIRAAIETSRGCPKKCEYCAWPLLTSPEAKSVNMRYIPMEQVMENLDYLLEHPNVSALYFCDSNPFLRPKRAEVLLEHILRKNKDNKEIVFEMDPEDSPDHILKLIAQVSQGELALGLQSSNAQVNKAMSRTFHPEVYTRNVEVMQNANPSLDLWISLIIGLPEDNLERFYESVNYTLSMNPKGMRVHELTVLPGSTFYTKEGHGGLTFLQDPPHNLIIEPDSDMEHYYDTAKNVGYHTFLIHCVSIEEKKMQNGTPIISLKEKLRNFALENNQRIVDVYRGYIDALKMVDIPTLGGRNIQKASSWFFNEYAREFIANKDNITALHRVYDDFANTGRLVNKIPLPQVQHKY